MDREEEECARTFIGRCSPVVGRKEIFPFSEGTKGGGGGKKRESAGVMLGEGGDLAPPRFHLASRGPPRRGGAS